MKRAIALTIMKWSLRYLVRRQVRLKTDLRKNDEMLRKCKEWLILDGLSER